MGDDARLRTMCRALDDLLDSEAFGSGACHVTADVQFGRAQLEKLGATLPQAWTALAALEPTPTPLDPEDEAYFAELREKAKTNPRIRAIVEQMDADAAAMAEDERKERTLYGPFYALRIPSEIAQVLDSPAHYAVMGFRALHGLEILREALPELAALVRVSRPQPN